MRFSIICILRNYCSIRLSQKAIIVFCVLEELGLLLKRANFLTESGFIVLFLFAGALLPVIAKYGWWFLLEGSGMTAWVQL